MSESGDGRKSSFRPKSNIRASIPPTLPQSLSYRLDLPEEIPGSLQIAAVSLLQISFPASCCSDWKSKEADSRRRHLPVVVYPCSQQHPLTHRP
jgi:hypothetical protein